MKLRRLIIIAIILGLSLNLTGGCQQRPTPETFIDDMGRQITLDEVPQRIVSHVPSITETLFALDLGERVVGVSDYCNYPEEARSKPSIGGYYGPSIENIIAQNPDLVLTDGEGVNQDIIPVLEGLGVACVVIAPKDIEGILNDIELLGGITGSEKRAEEMVSEIRNRLDKIVSQVEGTPRVKVLYIYDATDLNYPWTAGPGSFADALVAMAGGENIAADTEAAWAQISIEVILSANPEVIIVDASMGTAMVLVEELKAHPVWRETAAVKSNRIHIIDGDLVNRSGPRIAQGLEEIARSIHPELF